MINKKLSVAQLLLLAGALSCTSGDVDNGNENENPNSQSSNNTDSNGNIQPPQDLKKQCEDALKSKGINDTATVMAYLETLKTKYPNCKQDLINGLNNAEKEMFVEELKSLLASTGEGEVTKETKTKIEIILKAIIRTPGGEGEGEVTTNEAEGEGEVTTNEAEGEGEGEVTTNEAEGEGEVTTNEAEVTTNE